MQILWAKQALTDNGWEKDVRITIAPDGRIADVAANSSVEGQQLDLVLPAPGNLHSHAFQRAMAGLTEYAGNSTKDSFWSWRDLMYRMVEHIRPEDLQAIAAYVQMEMLEAGYGSVGEFHYLHHGPSGQAYLNLTEMSDRIMAAQQISGIGLTHLPVLYAQGGCDGRALAGGQKRFGNDLDRYQQLLTGCAQSLKDLPMDCMLGVAPHSLRAVSPDMLNHVPDLLPAGPIHIHIAEQTAEVVEIIAHLGARPVEWLLNIFHVDPRWCLIHATQMTNAETLGLAKSGAVAGLCPITEANLGDGIFEGVHFLQNGGKFGLGSDSNVLISLTEEMRMLEYTQRLRDHSRAALSHDRKSVGRMIFEQSAMGAAQALGRDSGVITKGKWADLLEIRTDHVDLEGLAGDQFLDAWVFACRDNLVRNVWSAGRQMVKDGAHIARREITSEYRAVLTRLRGKI